MRVFPKPLDIGDEEGFNPEKDIFKRAPLGAGMTNLVSNVEDPLVIALDGAWGSGKSTFLKMWAGELRKAGHPVIYFDAFENDYVDDAFAALARELLELAEESKPASKRIAKGFREKAAELGSMLLRGSVKIGTQAAIRAFAGGLLNATDLGKAGEEVAVDAEDLASSYMDEILSHPRKQKDIIKSFRTALEDLPNQLSNDESDRPLIFIIDELDRCKPIFALNLLERIKHFLSVRNVHFVLGVNLDQLENSVSYAYGPKVNSAEYLRKFISLRIDLIDQYEAGLRYKDDLKIYANKLVIDLGIPDYHDGPVPISVAMAVKIVRREKGSFRTMERFMGMLAVAMAFAQKDRPLLGPLVGGLILMKLFRPELFRKAKLGTLTLGEALDFLDLRTLKLPTEPAGIAEMWWHFALADQLPEQITRWGNTAVHGYPIHERRELMPYTANEVVDRLTLPD